MVSIYLIEDINDLRDVGSTKQKIDDRLSRHRADKRIGKYCSSSKLNLDNCMIIELESCDLEQRKERERYYINNIDCVNQNKLNFDKDKQKQYHKEYREKNKDYHKEYREKNKDKKKEYDKDWNENKKGKKKE